MPSLFEHFQDLEDPRWDRYKLHKFSDLLFITICAAICGADGWEDIFAHAKEDWLRGYLELPNGLPFEVRQGWAVGDVEWLRHQDRWASLRSLVAVEARRIVDRQQSLERRSYLTSLAREAPRLLAAVRGQWGIENPAACRRRSASGLGWELFRGCESDPEGSWGGQHVVVAALEVEPDSTGDFGEVEAKAEAQTSRVGRPLSRNSPRNLR